MESTTDGARHWRDTYEAKRVDEVSWYQTDPAVSLALAARAGVGAGTSLVDVGGGASPFVDRLLDRGVTDVTVLDIADSALAAARTRLADRSAVPTWLVQDVLTWQPSRRYDVWHDRAVFHFLTEPADQERYRRVVDAALAPDGHLIVGTFAADGPTHCSGLPVARYDADQLAARFPGFTVLSASREEHHTPWDTVQPFTWLLLRRSPAPPR